MPSPADSQSEPQSRLERVLAEYLRSVDEGRPIDRAELLAAYPDLGDELQSFFRNRDAMARISERFKAHRPKCPRSALLSTRPMRPRGCAILATMSFSKKSPAAEWAWSIARGKSA